MNLNTMLNCTTRHARGAGVILAAMFVFACCSCDGQSGSVSTEFGSSVVVETEPPNQQGEGRDGPKGTGGLESEAGEPSAPTTREPPDPDAPEGETNMPYPDEQSFGGKDSDPSTTISPDRSARTDLPRIVKRTVPGTDVSYEMVYIPGGRVRVPDQNGEEIEVEVEPYWIGRTELTWEMYDIFVFNLDEGASNPEADAVSRPSRPYIPPDRGFGHGGYPAISMTTQGATKFCEWLSAKTGRRYRVPTVAQWRLAALGSSKGPYSFGTDASAIDDYAWTQRNSPEQTQPVARLKPNSFGLFDVQGNVMEWCQMGEDFVACGGSYYSEPEDSSCFSIAEQDWEWNMTDPQIPKSPWWLSDASWVGLRIVCDDETVGTGTPKQGEKDE